MNLLNSSTQNHEFFSKDYIKYLDSYGMTKYVEK